MSACDLIIAYCKQHGSITQMEATNALGCTRLSGRIWDLKHRPGIVVTDAWEYGVNRYQKPTRYKRYYVTEEAK